MIFNKDEGEGKILKIGIMTFWTSKDNYGQQLQCYALQTKLKSLGYDPYLIRYDFKNDYWKDVPFYVKCFKALNFVKVFKYLKALLIAKKYEKKVLNDEKINNRHFEEFQEKHFNMSRSIYYSFADLKKNPPEADVYIVGSDQVWNWFDLKDNHFINYINAFMLNFGKETTKRISYAASCGGRTGYSNLEIQCIKELISRLDMISVREESGIRFCEKFGIKKAFVVCDPTLLLKKEDYRKLYLNEKLEKPEKPYVMFYYVENGGDFDKSLVYSWAKSKNLEVKYITANNCQDKYEKKYATIPEWIYLIDNANYVITNSFHCCIFSIIFRKPFGVIKLSGKQKNMNDRLKNLFQICNIRERYIYGSDFSALDFPVEEHCLTNTNDVLVWDMLKRINIENSN